MQIVYNALLGLFHQQIVAKVQAEMNDALTGPAPKAINRLLATVPSSVR